MIHAHYFRLAVGRVRRTIELGRTPAGDPVWADVDARGRLLGVELIGPLPHQDVPMPKADTRLKLPHDFLGNVKALLATPPPPKGAKVGKPKPKTKARKSSK